MPQFKAVCASASLHDAWKIGGIAALVGWRNVRTKVSKKLLELSGKKDKVWKKKPHFCKSCISRVTALYEELTEISRRKRKKDETDAGHNGQPQRSVVVSATTPTSSSASFELETEASRMQVQWEFTIEQSKRKPPVRTKLVLRPLEGKARITTMAKRRRGLLKKAYELSVLCDAQILVHVKDQGGNTYTYASHDNLWNDVTSEGLRVRRVTGKKVQRVDEDGQAIGRPAVQFEVPDTTPSEASSVAGDSSFAVQRTPQAMPSLLPPYLRIPVIRTKLVLQPLEGKARIVTMHKRKRGLFKKAYELSVLCEAQILVHVKDQGGNTYTYASHDNLWNDVTSEGLRVRRVKGKRAQRVDEDGQAIGRPAVQSEVPDTTPSETSSVAVFSSRPDSQPKKEHTPRVIVMSYPMGGQPFQGGYGAPQPQPNMPGLRYGQPAPQNSQFYGSYGQQVHQNVYSINPWQTFQFNTEDELRYIFQQKMSQRFQAIQAQELQEILNTTPRIRDYYRISWSLELCKIMIAMLDRSRDGLMQYNELQELLQCLTFWHQTFCQYDADRSGYMEAHEMTRCVHEKLGYSLSAVAMQTLLKRYSRIMDDGRQLIAFDDFVACCVRLRAYTEAFRARDRNAHGGAETGSYQFSYDDFLQCTMCL